MRLALVAALILATASTRSVHADVAGSTFVPWRADHHMHLGSSTLVQASDTLCRKLGEDDCPPPSAEAAIAPAERAVAELDKVGARKGVVLSEAYMFGSPFLVESHYDVTTRMREENEFVAQQVARFPDRLVGFFSVAPLAPSAMAEVDHWCAVGQLHGMKLHLANSRIDFRNPSELRTVASIVRRAARCHLPMVIHVKGGHFQSRDAEAFIRTVLPAAGDAWVQIAHAGGWGDYDALTAQILSAWAAHFATHDPAVRHVLFDLAYVVRPEMTVAQARDLAQQMRTIGLLRFVLGSDYDEATPQETDGYARAKLPLSDDEWRTVAQNCAPWAC